MSSNDYVRIESADGYTFVVARNVACASGTLRTSLDTEKGFGESSSGVCKLEERGVIVAKVIEYLSYKVQYADFNAADIKDDFTDRIDPYIALELLTAADYLEV